MICAFTQKHREKYAHKLQALEVYHRGSDDAVLIGTGSTTKSHMSNLRTDDSDRIAQVRTTICIPSIL